jgi:hypothetical protein
MTNTPKDNVKDIFTNKPLSDIESKRLQEQEDHLDYMKEIMTTALEIVQSHIDSGNVTGIPISATTKTGVILPQVIHSDENSMLRLNFIADEIKRATQDACAKAFGMFGEELE